MSKTERGVRDRTGPYAGSYERIGGGRREQCYKDEDKKVTKIDKIKFWGGK